MNRRREMLEAALDAFVERGYEGTSIADLAEATGLSKAAFSYHFTDKEEILVEVAEPLIADLEALVAGHDPAADPEQARDVLCEYTDVLIRHRTVAAWVDGDKSVLNHPVVGRRLRRTNRAMRSLLLGPRDDRAARVRATAVLGALWRPVRNLPDVDLAAHRDDIVAVALEGLF